MKAFALQALRGPERFLSRQPLLFVPREGELEEGLGLVLGKIILTSVDCQQRLANNFREF